MNHKLLLWQSSTWACKSTASLFLVPPNKISLPGTRYASVSLLAWFHTKRRLLQVLHKGAKIEYIWNIIDNLLGVYENDKELH